MTRDFNNQRREDQRPDSRGSSSRRNGEERPSRPARPRLNRDMVDRAWENGARQNHADYRTRSEGTNHPPRDNRRPNQHSNQYSAQNSNYGRKPYGGNRQENYRPGEHSPRRSNGSRPGSFESSMRTFDDQKYNQYERRGYSNQPSQDEQRPGNHGNTQHPNSRSQYQGRDQFRSPQRREFDRDSRPPRNFERGQSQARDYDRRDRREPRSYDRDRRSSRDETGPDKHNPRWQSRPGRQYNNSSRRPQEYTRYGKEQELFEGDYEHFDTNNSGQSHTRPVRAERYTPQRPEERQVTRLADGRVLKGTPNEQNRNAEFWTEIAKESGELVQPIESSIGTEADTERPTDLPNASSTKGKPKPRARTASSSTRDGKTTKLKSRRQSTPKPRSTGPKPSQRGYKWPKPTEEE